MTSFIVEILWYLGYRISTFHHISTIILTTASEVVPELMTRGNRHEYCHFIGWFKVDTLESQIPQAPEKWKNFFLVVPDIKSLADLAGAGGERG